MNTDEVDRRVIEVGNLSAATTNWVIEHRVSSVRFYLTRRWTPTRTAKRGDDEKEDDEKKDG